jgi:hypothetical protein
VRADVTASELAPGAEHGAAQPTRELGQALLRLVSRVIELDTVACNGGEDLVGGFIQT